MPKISKDIFDKWLFESDEFGRNVLETEFIKSVRRRGFAHEFLKREKRKSVRKELKAFHKNEGKIVKRQMKLLNAMDKNKYSKTSLRRGFKWNMKQGRRLGLALAKRFIK